MLNNWIKGTNGSYTFADSNISIDSLKYADQVDSLEDYSVIILSHNDDRAIKVKESLGRFSNHFDKIKIIDLGFLIKEDPSYNIQLFLDLYHSGLTTVVLDKSYHWFSAITSVLKRNYPKSQNTCFSNKIVFSEFGLQNDYLSFQRHLVELNHLSRIADHSINSMSLGKMRADISQLEPILRDTWNAYFDVNAVRKADMPGSFDSLPSGLTCEECCQIFKYLGGGTSLKNLMIGGDFVPDEVTCNNIAQMIWYFLEGKNNSPVDHPSSFGNVKQYIVEKEDLDESFTFVFNEISGRWWFKIAEDKRYVACSHDEYLQTIEKDLPSRLLLHYAKIN